MLLLAATTALAQTAAVGVAPLRVELSGVEGDVEENVRTVLGIARAAEEGEVPVDRIQRLHGRADAEIELALQPFGYYRPTVSGSMRREDGTWVARYRIDPGPPLLVRRVDLALSGEGRQAPAFRRAAAEFPLRPGDTLHHARYEEGKLAFLAIAADSGYLEAEFDTSEIRIDREAYTSELRLRFDTGPRFLFGPVTFRQDVLDPGLLRSRVPFRPGDPYRADRLLELQTVLTDDPWFDRVEVRPLPGRARGLRVPIRVDLVPRKAAAYQVGAGYGTDTGPRGTLGAQWRRLNRRGHHAEAELTVSALERSLSAQYMIPAVLSPTGVLSLVGGYANLDPTTSHSSTFLAGGKLGRPRGEWRETLSLLFQHEAFEVGPDSGTADLLIPGASWELTRADDPVFPERGYRARFALQGSQRGALAGVSFLQLQASGKLIRSLGPRLRVLARLEVGRTFTSDLHRLPATLRFFTGGDQSVRGYRYLELGPRDAAGRSFGGRALIAGSLEVDYRFLESWAVAAFYDAGNALDSFSSFSLERGAGGGIRWLSPIGLVRVDAAFAVSRPGSPLRIHFSIGPDL